MKNKNIILALIVFICTACTPKDQTMEEDILDFKNILRIIHANMKSDGVYYTEESKPVYSLHIESEILKYNSNQPDKIEVYSKKELLLYSATLKKNLLVCENIKDFRQLANALRHYTFDQYFDGFDFNLQGLSLKRLNENQEEVTALIQATHQDKTDTLTFTQFPMTLTFEGYTIQWKKREDYIFFLVTKKHLLPVYHHYIPEEPHPYYETAVQIVANRWNIPINWYYDSGDRSNYNDFKFLNKTVKKAYSKKFGNDWEEKFKSEIEREMQGKI